MNHFRLFRFKRAKPCRRIGFYWLTVEQLDELLNSYASGKIARRNVEEATGLWLSDILAELRRRGLQLPKVDTRAHLNDKQLDLYSAIFSKQ